MGDGNRFSKPVAFNKKSADDQLILKHVARKNFSGYVKKLILEDIKNKAQSKPQNDAVEVVKKVDGQIVTLHDKKPITPSERLEELKKRGNQSPPKVFTPRKD